MLLYELTRLVEEGRSAKDIPEEDLQSRKSSTSELELLLASLRADLMKREMVKA